MREEQRFRERGVSHKLNPAFIDLLIIPSALFHPFIYSHFPHPIPC